MRLSQLYKSNNIDISVELFPPKTELGIQELFREVERLSSRNVAFFSMTYGAAGTTKNLTLNLADQLKNRLAVETMCHLTVVGQSKSEVREALQFLRTRGIYNIIALRGDPPPGERFFTPHSNGFHYAVDLVREAKNENYFSIAVAGFPEMHPDSKTRKSDIEYLKRKVDAGADAIITQLFFDNRFYYEYVDSVRKAGIRIPVIPGILPILSASQVKRFTALCKSKIPNDVSRELEKCGDDLEQATLYGIDLATKQCQDLIKNGVKGLHFYCLNKSRSVRAVLSNLGY